MNNRGEEEQKMKVRQRERHLFWDQRKGSTWVTREKKQQIAIMIIGLWFQ